MKMEMCKAGHCYWIEFEHGGSAVWCPARLTTDRGYFKPTDFACMLPVENVLTIGPEITEPPKPRKPGIYRVKWMNEWTAAELRTSGDWWLLGSQSVYKEDSFQCIGEFLGPVEPPTE